MAETSAQKRQRKLHEAIVAAIVRKESPQESAATEKLVTNSRAETPSPAATTASETPSPAATTASETPSPAATTASETKSETPAPTPRTGGGTISIPKPQVGQHKTYQKHVLFAVVSAFLIQIVANGVTLPTKGS